MKLSKKVSMGPRRSRQQMSETGTQRTSAFSYHANRLPEAERSRTSRPRRQINWHQIPSFITAALLVVSFVYLSSLSTNPKIASQKVDDKSSEALLRDQTVYQKAAQEILSDSIVNRSKITFDSRSFDQQMRLRFPEVTATAVTLPIMARRPVVELVIAKPALVATVGSKRVVVDATGRVVAAASEVSGLSSLGLPNMLDESDTQVKMGQGLLPKQSVDFITTFTDLLNAKQQTVESVTLPKTASEARFKVQGKNYQVKTSLLNDPRQTAGTYLAAIKRLDQDKTNPGEYIDLRVDEKIYVK